MSNFWKPEESNTAQKLVALSVNEGMPHTDWLLVAVGMGGMLVKEGVYRFRDGSMVVGLKEGKPIEYVGGI